MSRIRQADYSDVRAIHELATELLEQSVYSGIPMDDTKFKRLVAMCIQSSKAAVFVVDGDDGEVQGFVMGVIDDLFFSKYSYATDLCVYVRQEYRAAGAYLMRRFVRWAKSHPKVAQITFGISSGIGDVGRVGRMYERMGFVHTGGLYVMRVQP